MKGIFTTSKAKYSFENYESGEGLVELSEDKIDIVDRYTELIKKNHEDFIEEIQKVRALITSELDELKQETLQKYISEDKVELLKGYLQYLGKYFKFTSKILNKFNKLSDKDKLQYADLVAKKLEQIEEILNPKVQKQTPVTGNGEKQQPRAPIRGHVAPSEPERKKVSFADDVIKPKRSSQANHQKSKNNSNHNYIYWCSDWFNYKFSFRIRDSMYYRSYYFKSNHYCCLCISWSCCGWCICWCFVWSCSRFWCKSMP